MTLWIILSCCNKCKYIIWNKYFGCSYLTIQCHSTPCVEMSKCNQIHSELLKVKFILILLVLLLVSIILILCRTCYISGCGMSSLQNIETCILG